MGSSLRKKRRAKPSGSTVKVGRVKKTKQHVKVVPVRLPGAAEDTQWKEDTTHMGNYSSVGIVSDPNALGKTGRNSKSIQSAETRENEPKDTSVAATAIVGGDEVRGLLGQVRSTGLAPPKRLTTKQRRVVGALVAKHGDDLNAMARDRKLNAMQHTIAQLRELVVSFVAYPDLLEGGGPLGFRAPIKTSLKGRNKVR
jgi:nucleolar protein 16